MIVVLLSIFMFVGGVVGFLLDNIVLGKVYSSKYYIVYGVNYNDVILCVYIVLNMVKFNVIKLCIYYCELNV